MGSNDTKNLIRTILLFVVFLLFTVLVCKIDVKAIGPQSSSVGLAGLNGAVAKLFPYNSLCYSISKYLGYFAILICVFFAAIGLLEFFGRKSLSKVDPKIIILGVFYVAVVLFYIMFMKVVVNYRPILEDGALESSYPSSHTMLAVCVFLSAAIQISSGKGSAGFKKAFSVLMIVLTVVMVVTRTVSGVHWLTDIIGGVILSAALLSAYQAAISHVMENNNGRKEDQ